jgi:hypothetical protein
MPRHRPLFTLCSALSLLLCAAVCVLWVRSTWLHDNLTLALGSRAAQLTSGGGRLVLGWSRPGVPANVRARGGGVRWTVEPPFRWTDVDGNPLYARRRVPLLGLAYVGTPQASGLLAPHWLACLATATLPGVWLASYRHRLRQHRRRAGLCPHCGYDLRATPDRCPECGHEHNGRAAAK